ncbi:MAG: hypothetical protein K6G22_04850, partial [Lachnospiraceae bacterium]|nr:hypothetical protein [Lachnospiraceae bacterium]
LKDDLNRVLNGTYGTEDTNDKTKIAAGTRSGTEVPKGSFSQTAGTGAGTASNVNRTADMLNTTTNSGAADEIKKRLAEHDKQKDKIREESKHVLNMGLCVLIAFIMFVLYTILLILDRKESGSAAITVLNALTFGKGARDGIVSLIGELFGKTLYVSALSTLVAGGAKFIAKGAGRLFSPGYFAIRNLGAFLSGLGASVLLYLFFTGTGGFACMAAGIAGIVVSLRILGGLRGGRLHDLARILCGEIKGFAHEKTDAAASGMCFGYVIAILLTLVPEWKIKLICGLFFLLVGTVLTLTAGKGKE